MISFEVTGLTEAKFHEKAKHNFIRTVEVILQIRHSHDMAKNL